MASPAAAQGQDFPRPGAGRASLVVSPVPTQGPKISKTKGYRKPSTNICPGVAWESLAVPVTVLGGHHPWRALPQPMAMISQRQVLGGHHRW